MSKTPFRMPQRAATADCRPGPVGERRGGAAVAAEKTPRPERPAGKIARLTIDLPA